MAQIDIDTGISYSGGDWMYMSSNEQKWRGHLTRLAAKRPEDCIIVKKPEDNGGVIYARIRANFLKIAPPRELHLTDERRAEMAENLRRNIENKNKQAGDTTCAPQ